MITTAVRSLFILMSLVPTMALASSLQFKFGSSMNVASPFVNKLVALSYRDKLTSILDYQIETGLFANNDVGYRVRTGYVSASIGAGVTGSWYYSRVFVGPAAVSRTDDRLSSTIQLSTDAEIGIRDNRSVELGLGYKHFSNAGIAPGPNKGRDFMYLKLSLPLGRTYR